MYVFLGLGNTDFECPCIINVVFSIHYNTFYIYFICWLEFVYYVDKKKPILR
jgi:hypothetical protein